VFLYGDHVAKSSSFLYNDLVDYCLVLLSIYLSCSFTFRHCIVCPSINGFSLHLWYIDFSADILHIAYLSIQGSNLIPTSRQANCLLKFLFVFILCLKLLLFVKKKNVIQYIFRISSEQ
jgi:hypothetical protein